MPIRAVVWRLSVNAAAILVLFLLGAGRLALVTIGLAVVGLLVSVVRSRTRPTDSPDPPAPTPEPQAQQPLAVRLEALIGIAVGALVICVGDYGPVTVRFLLVLGALWTVASLILLLVAGAWEQMPRAQRERTVMLGHVCALIPLLIAVLSGDPGGFLRQFGLGEE
jgi:hypothetical protein